MKKYLILLAIISNGVTNSMNFENFRGKFVEGIQSAKDTITVVRDILPSPKETFNYIKTLLASAVEFCPILEEIAPDGEKKEKLQAICQNLTNYNKVADKVADKIKA